MGFSRGVSDISHLKRRKVFGVGFSKTGTSSLEQAVAELGLNVCHGHWQLKHNDYHLALYVGGQVEELRRMSSYWDAFFDAPWGGGTLYRDLHEWYPDACFIHSVRDPESWYQSLSRMVSQFDEQKAEGGFDAFHREGRYGAVLFFRHVFGVDSISEKEAILEVYNRTNREVEAFFRSNGASYLKIDLADGQGWSELASFLEVSEPDTPFPHRNQAGRTGRPGKGRSRLKKLLGLR